MTPTVVAMSLRPATKSAGDEECRTADVTSYRSNLMNVTGRDDNIIRQQKHHARLMLGVKRLMDRCIRRVHQIKPGMQEAN